MKMLSNILKKSSWYYSVIQKKDPDFYLKFDNSFNKNEIKKEIQPLFFQSKKMLLIGTSKEEKLWSKIQKALVIKNQSSF